MRTLHKILFFMFFVSHYAASQSTYPVIIEQGVSLGLAEQRAQNISNVHYKLFFQIPEKEASAVQGKVRIDFTLSNASEHLVLDFNASKKQVKNVWANANSVPYIYKDGHIVINKKYITLGQNSVEVEFVAGNSALNRNPEYLYTLFVPDRASTAFPCFDQPDIKGKFDLSLNVPKDWTAIGNGALENKTCEETSCTYDFFQTEPISTYLFAFVAGKFEQVTKTVEGNTLTMYHRETDSAKVARNQDEIFELHNQSLKWLGEYTKIPMPFQKFDFVLIPSFQFGGMEHTGAILYRASQMMLEETATQNQKLSRANLIAHETSHMWFGNYVTMKWFNDVWLKEVFANFIAAKVTNPTFPEINHSLRFLMSHHPIAYSEDRTLGSHPIQQELENLKDAGTLYGRIIYQKAPVVMQQLEQMMGEDKFREGVQEYLKTFAFSNAVWEDLITILDSKTPQDLKKWSETWVKEPGMPHISVAVVKEDDLVKSIKIKQHKTSEQGEFWSQKLETVIVTGDSTYKMPVVLAGQETELEDVAGMGLPDLVLANGTGLGYGFFMLDKQSMGFLLENIYKIKDPMTRGVAWISLYEEMLHGEIKPEVLMETVLKALDVESEPLNTQNILDYLTTIYWKFYTPQQRKALAPKLEEQLERLSYESPGQSAKSAYFKTYVSIATTPDAVENLKLIWQKRLEIPGLSFSEVDYTFIACELALRGIPEAQGILQTQVTRIHNKDRKANMEFILPALSPDQKVRDEFFESLKQEEMRKHEPWVLQSMVYLNHPLRAKSAEKYIKPSLELLEEIQRTGDIFFPKRWLKATFSGHQSSSAVRIINEFLEERPDYPYRLRNKILQAADPLFIASKMTQM